MNWIEHPTSWFISICSKQLGQRPCCAWLLLLFTLLCILSVCFSFCLFFFGLFLFISSYFSISFFNFLKFVNIFLNPWTYLLNLWCFSYEWIFFNIADFYQFHEIKFKFLKKSLTFFQVDELFWISQTFIKFVNFVLSKLWTFYFANFFSKPVNFLSNS